LEQIKRLEASRDELARQQGQFKGRIAKVYYDSILGGSSFVHEFTHISCDFCSAALENS
jgi:hypothetical protein